MDNIWIIAGAVLTIVGIIGCILPFLPGPPLCFLALLLQQFRSDKPFSTSFLVTWAFVVAVVVLLDYLVPVYGTKKFGGSKYGLWGCMIGFLLVFWVGPWGIIVGPFIGAFVGEWAANRNSRQALRAAIGSFVGFLFGTLIKLIACLVMAYYFLSSFLML